MRCSPPDAAKALGSSYSNKEQHPRSLLMSETEAQQDLPLLLLTTADVCIRR